MLDASLMAEINSARTNLTQTSRAMSPGMEKRLHLPAQVLDHGFVRPVDYMGNDTAIVQAARVSYGIGTKHVSDDAKLIRYLMRRWHTSPFEMCEIKLHVKLPIFVARHWIRHRTANVNEYSARYSVLDKEFYIPEPDQMAAQSQVNNQGRGAVLGYDESRKYLEILKDDALRNYSNYEEMMRTDEDEGKLGLARELARMNLPANIYTQWYWKTDLSNLFHFLRLRSDPHAQYEIQVYANAISDIVMDWCPVAHQAYLDYRQNSAQLSSMDLAVVKRMLSGEVVDSHEGTGMSKREFNDLKLVLGLA